MTNETPSNRRRFYVAFIYGLWSLITAVLAIPAALYLLLPPRASKKNEWVEVGDIADLDAQTPEEMVFRRQRRDGWKTITEKTTAWVARLSETEVIALAPQCTHLGCAYHWDDKRKNFICPCHTSAFSLQGNVLAGPAPRSLDRYQTRIEGTKLYVGRVIEGKEVD